MRIPASNVNGYIAIYFLYYMIIVFQVQTGQTALSIRDRFKRINIILRSTLLNGKRSSSDAFCECNWFCQNFSINFTERASVHITRVPSLRNINRVVDELGRNKENSNTTNSKDSATGKRAPDIVPTISSFVSSLLVKYLIIYWPYNESVTLQTQTHPSSGRSSWIPCSTMLWTFTPLWPKPFNVFQCELHKLVF